MKFVCSFEADPVVPYVFHALHGTVLFSRGTKVLIPAPLSDRYKGGTLSNGKPQAFSGRMFR